MHTLIREATADDAQTIVDLTRACWTNKVAVSAISHRETAAQVLEHLHTGGGFILLDGDTPVASVRWVPIESEPRVWEILRMGVLPAYRGAHLSEHLLEAVVHRALASGIDELHLAVRPDQTRLLDLYAALGFELAPELEATFADAVEPLPAVMRRKLS